MNLSSTANFMLQPHAGCEAMGLVVWNSTTRHYRHGFAFVRKDWMKRRRAEIVME